MFAATMKAASLFSISLGISVFLFLTLVITDKIKKQNNLAPLETASISFVFASLGLVVGLLIGSARETAVGAIVPSLLTFIGGLAIYLITKETSKILTISASVLSISFALIVGTTLGYYERYASDQQMLLDRYNMATLKWQAQVEYRINTYRKAHKLPPVAFK